MSILPKIAICNISIVYNISQYNKLDKKTFHTLNSSGYSRPPIITAVQNQEVLWKDTNFINKHAGKSHRRVIISEVEEQDLVNPDTKPVVCAFDGKVFVVYLPLTDVALTTGYQYTGHISGILSITKASQKNSVLDPIKARLLEAACGKDSLPESRIILSLTAKAKSAIKKEKEYKGHLNESVLRR